MTRGINLQAIERILDTGVMAAARLPSPESAVEVSLALLRGGVTAIEFSMTMPGALKAIADVATLDNKDISVGVGTVLDASTAHTAIRAGAEFIVSPTISAEVVKIGNRYGKPVITGALTPNEILYAFELGSKIVKVFPGGTLGPAYIRALLAPLSHIPLMPDGGVTLDNAEELIRAGSTALGIGSCLVDRDAIRDANFDRLTELAASFVGKVRHAREE